MYHWDLSQQSTFGTAIVWWPIVFCIPELGFKIKQFYSFLNSQVGSPKPFDYQCYSVRGIDWDEETNKVCVSAVTKYVYRDASRKVSVKLCTFVASFFICLRSCNASWLSRHKCTLKKNLKLYKLEFFLCALMTRLQNIERNFTFTRKCTENEERNEIGVSLSDSNEELGDKCLFDWNLINYWYNFQKNLHVFYQVRWSCWKIRHDDEYKLWLLFVKACRILTAPVITFRHFVLTHSSLMQFCKKFETKNGQLEVTPNMHLHSHLINCVVDYGPLT